MSSATIRQTFLPTGCIVLVLTAILAFNGCGGGGGGGDFMAGGGIGGTGVTVGAISGFGSVIVNDIDFDTRNAQVVINGQTVGSGDSDVRSKLARDMIVRVEAKYRSDGTALADRIVFTSNVR